MKKRQNRKKVLQKIKQGGPSCKLFWSDLKGRKSRQVTRMKSSRGAVVEEPEEILEVLAQHWEELGKARTGGSGVELGDIELESREDISDLCQKWLAGSGRGAKAVKERERVEEGLGQGCPLLPLLYSIYVMGMMEELEQEGIGVKVDGMWWGALLYAELLKMLNVVGRYANKWKFTFNARKSKVLVVGKKCDQGTLNINGKEMEEVESFKYLGV